MAEAKNTYEVSLAGMPMKLRSSHDEATVNELIEMVNEKVNEALKGNSNLAFQKAVLLAALHIAEDLVFLKRTALHELDQLETKTQNILTEMESSPLSRIRLDNI